MKTLLRSCFVVEPSDSLELFAQNYHALEESGLGFEVPEDSVIWRHIADFFRAHGHVPSIQSLTTQFTATQQLDCVDRLERLAMNKPRVRGDFLTHLEDRANDRRNMTVINLAKDMAQIATDKLEVKDVRGNSSRLRGADDAIDWVLAHAAEVRRPDSGPEPLDDSGPLPDVPLDSVPACVAEFATALAAETCTPVCVALMYALAELSACAQRSRYLVIDAWEEMVGLYCLCVLKTGELKTPLVKRCHAPVVAWEREQRESFAKAKATHEIRVEGAKTRMKDKALGQGEREAAIAELAELEAAPPVCPRVTMRDATPEALADVASRQYGSIAMLSPEGGPLKALTGIRYSKDRSQNLTYLLQGYSGEQIIIDRKTSDPIFVDSPSFALGVALQPSVLQELANIRGAEDEGLLPRMLFVVPSSLVGSRNFLDAPSMPEAIVDRWATTVRALLDLPASQERTALRCTPAAARRARLLKQSIEDREAPGGDLAALAGWANKLAGNVMRIAAVCRLAEDPFATTLEAEHVERAAPLVEFLVAHARAAYRLSSTDTAVERAQHVLDWISRDRPTQFSRRDAQRGLHGRTWLRSARDLDAPLALLVERRWIRAVQPAPTGGRPSSPTYVVLHHGATTQPARPAPIIRPTVPPTPPAAAPTTTRPPSIGELLARHVPQDLDVPRGKPPTVPLEAVPLEAMRSMVSSPADVTVLDYDTTTFPAADGQQIEVHHLPYVDRGSERVAEVIAIDGDPVPPDAATWWLGVDPAGRHAVSPAVASRLGYAAGAT